MRKYIKPTIEIQKFDICDIITESTHTPDIDNGAVSFPSSWNDLLNAQ